MFSEKKNVLKKYMSNAIYIVIAMVMVNIIPIIKVIITIIIIINPNLATVQISSRVIVKFMMVVMKMGLLIYILIIMNLNTTKPNTANYI